MEHGQFDVAIAGGGPAGLSAAIWLARYLHTVVLIDSGDPRNWETRGIHAYLGLPDVRPAELRGIGREEARRYGVRLVDACIERARQDRDHLFALELQTGTVYRARRLLLAFGIRDVWPAIPGLERVYGETAHVCPDCDGYESRAKRVVVVGSGKRAVATALKLTTWTSDVVVCTNSPGKGGNGDISDAHRRKLEALRIPIVGERITGIEHREGVITALRTASGASVPCDHLFFSIAQYPSDDLGVQLGCERDPDGRIVVDRTCHTSVYNVFAAGDIAPGPQLAIAAAASGAVAALAIHHSLLPDERKLD